MSLAGTLRFILGHPLNDGAKAEALRRYLGWQIRSRAFPGPVIIPFVNGSRLVARRGRPSSTGNLYTRLHEFPEMGFVLHALAEGDLFLDVGANIGAYSILAASLQGTQCIAFEPASDTYQLLVENVALNDYGSKITTHRMAIGDEHGEVLLTASLDTVNHIVSASDDVVPREFVSLRRLDEVLGDQRAAIMKIDVEGYEMPVIRGAEKTLRHDALLAVVLEMNGSGERYGMDEGQLDGMLVRHGFTALSYDPFTRRLISLPEVNPSGNRIYVRNRDKLQERLQAAAPFTIPGGRRI